MKDVLRRWISEVSAVILNKSVFINFQDIKGRYNFFSKSINKFSQNKKSFQVF